MFPGACNWDVVSLIVDQVVVQRGSVADTAVVCQVSRLWCRVAQPRLYRSMVVWDSSSRKPLLGTGVSALNDLQMLEILRNYQHLALAIRCMTLFKLSPSKLRELVTASATSCGPYLRTHVNARVDLSRPVSLAPDFDSLVSITIDGAPARFYKPDFITRLLERYPRLTDFWLSADTFLRDPTQFSAGEGVVWAAPPETLNFNMVGSDRNTYVNTVVVGPLYRCFETNFDSIGLLSMHYVVVASGILPFAPSQRLATKIRNLSFLIGTREDKTGQSANNVAIRLITL